MVFLLRGAFMTVDYRVQLDFQKVELGYVKTNDDSLIVVRVAIIDVKPTGKTGPFGPEFSVDFVVGISVRPSERVKEEIRDKPTIDPGKPVEEGWVLVEILDKCCAYEEVTYRAEDLGDFLVRVEVEPIMVAKNTLYKLPDNTPLYVVRWVPKVLSKPLKRGGSA
jgi:hypothetical protein